MTRKSKALIGCLILAGLGCGVTLAVAQHHMEWRHHDGMRGEMGFRAAMFCGDGARVDRLLDRLEERLKPTDAQRALFTEFKTGAKTAAEKIKSACPIERARNMPERLAMAEKRLEAALDAVHTVRPAADKLYASLSDEQKAAVNGLRRGWGGSTPQSNRPTP
jgi:hypothetical protein